MRAIVLAAACAAALAAPAFAQRAGLDFMKGAGLGDAEVEAMAAAERALYENEAAGVGAVELWTTQTTSGEARITFRGPREDGRPCVAIRHVAKRPGSDEVTVIPVRRCKAEDGRWLIAVQ